MEKLFNNLSDKIWYTSGARFEAQRRNLSLLRWSTFTLSSISVYLIFLSILRLKVADNIFSINIDYIDIFIILSTIYILIISLIENSNDYKLKAYIYHQCGIELDNLNQILKVDCEEFKKNNWVNSCNRLKEFLKMYQEILLKYSENHFACDYDMMRLKRKNEIENSKRLNIRQSIIVIFEFYILNRLLYFVMIATAFISLFYIFS